MNPEGFSLLKNSSKKFYFFNFRKIIDERVQTNDGIIKIFHLVTNALLFIDVLAFDSTLHGAIQNI
jgi:hypothetical protein